MTVLEALQSLVEYKNDELLAKALLDNNLTATTTYVSSTHKKSVDLSVADIYEHLAMHPILTEGEFSVNYNAKQLLGFAAQIRRKYGIVNSSDTTGKIGAVSRW